MTEWVGVGFVTAKEVALFRDRGCMIRLGVVVVGGAAESVHHCGDTRLR